MDCRRHSAVIPELDRFFNVPYPQSANEHEGLVVIFPKDNATPFPFPDNAAIYNADGSLRFRLKHGPTDLCHGMWANIGLDAMLISGAENRRV